MTLNQATFQLAEHIQNPALTTFSKFIATITEPIVLLALLLVTSIALYFKGAKIFHYLGYSERRGDHHAFFLASASILTAFLIKLLKNIFQVERPISTIIQETGYAFPSGHTTFAVVFFGLMTYLFAKPKYKIPATIISIIIITIVAFSRIYLQVHWLTDVLAGLALGGIILILSILIHKKNKF